AQAHGTKLGRLDGLPDSHPQRVHPGLDTVLWALLVLPPAARTRCLAAASPTQVLLEAMALRTHQSPGTAETRDRQDNGEPHGVESERSVAFVADARDPDRHDHSVALGVPRSWLDSRLVDLTSLSDLNRPVRTRRPWWCGEGGQQ